MDIETAVNQFAENVALQHAAIWGDADFEKSNHFARKAHESFEHLRGYGDDGRNSLMRLLFDQRIPVRIAAAVYLLRHCTAQATAVLKKEAAGSGILAFEAEQALERWKDGSWSLDLP